MFVYLNINYKKVKHQDRLSNAHTFQHEGSSEEDSLFLKLSGVIYGLIFFGAYKISEGNGVSMFMMFLQGEIRCYYFLT